MFDLAKYDQADQPRTLCRAVRGKKYISRFRILQRPGWAHTDAALMGFLL